MTSGFPATIDNFVNPTAVDNLNTATKVHHDQHTNVNDAVHAIELELGTNTKGVATSVRARMEAIEAALAAKLDDSQAGTASGLATLDAGLALVQSVPAANLTGTINVARIPNLSGAKILGTVGGGVAIPVDAVPSLPGTIIGSGTINVGRIPGLPGSQITSGTIAAARLPSSVTANANATVVADQAGRDAIALVDRADGKIVVQLDKMIIWIWRADNSTWVRVPNVQNSVLTAAATCLANQVWSNTGLGFDALAGEKYRIEVVSYALTASTSTIDIRYGWNWAGTGKMTSALDGVDTTVDSPAYNGSSTAHAVLAQTPTPLNESTGMGTPSGIPVLHRVAAYYECTVGGHVDLRFVQHVTHATFLPTMQIGSNLRAERIV